MRYTCAVHVLVTNQMADGRWHSFPLLLFSYYVHHIEECLTTLLLYYSKAWFVTVVCLQSQYMSLSRALGHQCSSLVWVATMVATLMLLLLVFDNMT